MAVTYKPLSGANARVQINGDNLPCLKWSINYHAEDVDATNFEGGGYSEQVDHDPTDASYLGTTQGVDITVEVLYDPANHALLTDVILAAPGYKINPFRIFPSQAGDAANFWNFTSVVVMGVSMDAEVRGAVRATLTLASDGPFTPAK